MIAIGAIVFHAFIVVALFRRWDYRTVKKIDPLARIERTMPTIEASGGRLPSDQTPIYKGLDDETFEQSTELVSEEQRLLHLLHRKAH